MITTILVGWVLVSLVTVGLYVVMVRRWERRRARARAHLLAAWRTASGPGVPDPMGIAPSTTTAPIAPPKSTPLPTSGTATTSFSTVSPRPVLLCVGRQVRLTWPKWG